jgi:homoserine O-acetyltransferase
MAAARQTARIFSGPAPTNLDRSAWATPIRLVDAEATTSDHGAAREEAKAVRPPVLGILALLLFSVAASGQDGQQQFASLGDLKLESGEVIRDCTIGYRTFGQLNADKSNVVLFPTWFTGTTADLQRSFGPGKLADTSAYYVVAVDALGNGVSTSPSNSRRQPRMKFPKITIRDMVNSQHQLLTQVLHLEHVRAVAGISMGGMQTFQWVVSYPGFMDKAVPIVGSPRLAPYDLLLWQAENDAIRSDPAWKGGNYKEQPARGTLHAFSQLMLSTPERYNETTRREEVLPSIDKAKSGPTFDANNHIRQSEAMMALDVSAPFGGSMERAGAAVKAKVLVVVAPSDHMVTPGPALEFARIIGAEVLELRSTCGHLAPGCEEGMLTAAVNAFLAR